VAEGIGDNPKGFGGVKQLKHYKYVHRAKRQRTNGATYCL
jgi:hypothetical protein